MARIMQNVRLVREFEFDLLFQRRQLEFHLQLPHFTALDRLREGSQRVKTEECKIRQWCKFDTLLSSTTGGNCQQCPSDRWVVSLSCRPLSMMEKEVLNKSLNFAPVPRHIPVPASTKSVQP